MNWWFMNDHDQWDLWIWRVTPLAWLGCVMILLDSDGWCGMMGPAVAQKIVHYIMKIWWVSCIFMFPLYLAAGNRKQFTLYQWSIDKYMRLPLLCLMARRLARCGKYVCISPTISSVKSCGQYNNIWQHRSFPAQNCGQIHPCDPCDPNSIVSMI